MQDNCDFDCCMKCYNRTCDNTQSTRCKTLLEEVATGADFYKKEVLIAEVGSDLYEDMLNMYYKMIMANNPFIWTLTAQNLDETLTVTLGHNIPGGTECLDCNLVWKSNKKELLLLAFSNCVRNFPVTKDYLHNILILQRKHMNNILSRLFQDRFTLILTGDRYNTDKIK